jgi:hypothetical protein
VSHVNTRALLPGGDIKHIKKKLGWGLLVLQLAVTSTSCVYS